MSIILQTICRICEYDNYLTDLTYGSNEDILLKYLQCANVSFMVDDQLPKYICKTCLNMLNTVYDFKIKCECAQKNFFDLLNGTIVDVKNIVIHSLSEEATTEIKQEILEDDEDDDDLISIVEIKEENLNDEFKEEHIEIDTVIDDIIENTQNSNEFISEIINQVKVENIEDDEIGNNLSIKEIQQQNDIRKIHVNVNGNETEIEINLINKPYKCNSMGCKETFVHEVQLLQHKQTPHQCPDCHMVMENTHNLIIHYGKTHKERLKKVDYPKQTFLNKKKSPYKKPYKCELCTQTFDDYVFLKHHRDKWHAQTIECNNCERRVKSLGSGHKCINKCPICICEFQDKTSLKIHLQCHYGEKTKVCYLCDKLFLNTYQLNRHIETHQFTWKFECTTCFLIFNNETQLKKHNSDVHQQITGV